MLKDNALTTIEKATRFIYGDFAEEVNEDAIADAINAASDAIEAYCRRKFGRQVHVQQIGEPSDELFLDYYPVRSVLSINGRPINTLRRAMYIDRESGVIDIASGGAVRGIVEYEAGYTLPKDATPNNPRDLPSDLEHACLHLIANMYVDETGFETEAASIKLGDWTVRDGNASQADIDSIIPNQVRVLLDNHRAWPVVV